MQGRLNLGEAARAAGVGRFVYVSYSGQIGLDDPLTSAKRTVERRLRESGMRYTILRPSYFMEVWLSPALGFDFPNRRATVYGSGENKISWISLEGVAEFAVRSVDDPAAENATIELGGAEALSPLQRAFAALMLACANGDPIPMEETLRRYPVRLRSVREYARSVLTA